MHLKNRRTNRSKKIFPTGNFECMSLLIVSGELRACKHKSHYLVSLMRTTFHSLPLMSFYQISKANRIEAEMHDWRR